MTNHKETGSEGNEQRYEGWGTSSGAGAGSTAGFQYNQGNGNGNGHGNGNGFYDRRWSAGVGEEGPRGNAQANWQSSWFSGANIDWSTFTGNGQGNGIGNQGTGNGLNNGQGYNSPPVSTLTFSVAVNSGGSEVDRATTSLTRSPFTAGSVTTSSAVGSLTTGTSISPSPFTGIVNASNRLEVYPWLLTMHLLYLLMMISL